MVIDDFWDNGGALRRCTLGEGAIVAKRLVKALLSESTPGREVEGDAEGSGG